MIRFHAIANAKAAEAYYSKSDGGEYYVNGELRQEWLGHGAELLGLAGTPDFGHFKRLIHGLDPHSGKQLTSKLLANRIPAWDVTASIPKGVTIALEHGDTRIQDALWEAARETMSDLEDFATTRVRKGGALEDRLTGNLVAFAVEHPETRPAKSDNMPDPDRHIHMVVFNVTYDSKEHAWKAVKFRPIMELRKFFDRRFDQRLASKLADLGYGIETKTKEGKYYSWDIKGMPKSVTEKFSRRTTEVDKLAEELGVGSAQGKDKLGATSRQFKRKDMTLDDYREYWQSRVTPAEAQTITNLIDAANLGQNPPQTNTADKAVAYAIDHHFERRSVMDWHDLAITAMERSMGGALPEEIEPDAVRQGALLKDGQVTTKEVLAEESRIIDFAREGKGTIRPLGADIGKTMSGNRVRSQPQFSSVDVQKEGDIRASSLGQQKGRPDESKQPAQKDYQSIYANHTATLSPEQQAASAGHFREAAKMATLSPEQTALVNHILTSADQIILVIGDAGTGKTHAVKSAFQQIDRPVEMLAPSVEASRTVLREAGFTKADTVASFLLSEERQAAVKGGVIWVDEAGLLAIKDLSRLTDIAKQQNARLVLQGDPKQHRSVVRHGNMINVLQEYAGLPVGRLTEVWRQKHKGYKAIVADIAKGQTSKAFDELNVLGWVRQVDSNTALVDDYMAGLKKDQLVIAPTHVECDEVTAAIRERLQEKGIVGRDEHVFETLRPLAWTNAEKGDTTRYEGTEVLQFHRNSGSFKAGDRVRVADWKPGVKLPNPAHFNVFQRGQNRFACGDRIRITNRGLDKSGKHKLNNGAQYTVAGFTDKGDITLSNGWVLPAGFLHIDHGYVSTSHASQGKTVDRVLIAMGTESKGAINAKQFYVSVSRGRESAKIYSDMPPDELKKAIQRTDTRKSATELMNPKPKKKRRGLDRIKCLLKKARDRFKELRAGRDGDNREHERQKEREHGIER
ncbi:MobF family relaxase [Zavarzinella formosa]|uniref:MobF family relaxase n=1 Tax=Zavarzinella formosa TaxID=360055 RepID=UPI0012FC056B|nr:MobF family relaxase [Zavarzinella formosa]